jgi:hypothetical protein
MRKERSRPVDPAFRPASSENHEIGAVIRAFHKVWDQLRAPR